MSTLSFPSFHRVLKLSLTYSSIVFSSYRSHMFSDIKTVCVVNRQLCFPLLSNSLLLGLTGCKESLSFIRFHITWLPRPSDHARPCVAMTSTTTRILPVFSNSRLSTLSVGSLVFKGGFLSLINQLHLPRQHLHPNHPRSLLIHGSDTLYTLISATLASFMVLYLGPNPDPIPWYNPIAHLHIESGFRFFPLVISVPDSPSLYIPEILSGPTHFITE